MKSQPFNKISDIGGAYFLPLVRLASPDFHGILDHSDCLGIVSVKVIGMQLEDFEELSQRVLMESLL